MPIDLRNPGRTIHVGVILVDALRKDSFATCPPLDIVLMGAHHGNYTPNEAELAFVRKSYEDSSAFLSICAGMMVFLQAGVLDGKTATGPQPFLSILKEKHPETNWVEKRYVRDGKIWTSGALLNGLDLMKAFVTETFGGPGTLAEAIIEIGAWPKRDVEYKGGE
ncbi:Isonitrile hydratase [Pseudocercospora fuligena]|uniref:Isonitrile hydratase n=1 Tax=Pseudocercospora fuligena TaxID=685502 RepID=A0A8H6RRS5_9PEZI|nr:Isonitrile hydratase [Pseudocercospora fuligena]